MNRSLKENRLNLVLRRMFWAWAIILGIIQTWRGRNFIWFDGVSYLDIADNYINGNLAAAINACWSPLYSWILGVAMFIFKPVPYSELLLVKFVNFTIYLFALISFDYFLKQLIAYSRKNEKQNNKINFILKKPDWVWLSLGYTIFIWSSVVWLIVHKDTPDMMVAGFVYLATAFVLRIATNPLVWYNYVMLGVVLGLGYLSKTFVLPLGLAYIVSIVCISDRISLKDSLFRVSVSLLVIFVFALPFITAISLQKHRITIGDAGRLNYAWYVSPLANDSFWQGSPETGTPVHTTRIINKDPEIQEFATPVSGSYPVWYDPSYWNEGIQPKFNLKKQVDVVVKNLQFFWGKFLGFFLLFFFFLASINKEKIIGLAKSVALSWRLFLPPIIGFIGFISFMDMVLIEAPWAAVQERYIAPFVVLLFIFLFYSSNIDAKVLQEKRFKIIVIVAMVLANTVLFCHPALSMMIKKYPLSGEENYYWKIANNLEKVGVKAGDKVALLGFDYGELYWARLGKVKIVAVMSADYFSSSEEKKKAALNKLKSLGVSAVIVTPFSEWKADISPENNWQKIGETNTYIVKL